jgi:AraC family transcriptional regulator
MKHILQRQETAGFTLSEALYPSGLKQPRHTHTLASFSFVLAGSYVENHGRHTRTRQPSTIVLHPPQESHSVAFQNEQVRILSVQLGFERLAYIREHSIVLDSSASRRTETIAWLGRRIHREFRRADAVSTLAIEGLIFEILAEASRSQQVATSEGKSPLWLKQAREFLHDNFSESLIFGDVAKAVGVHPVHLARVFREKTGYTMGEYVRRLRVEFACRQISATELPLCEIALAAGFADQSHLTKTFKSLRGLTPSEYRKTFRKS